VTAVLFVPFGVGLFVDARQILETLYGSRYADSAVPIVRWLAVSPLLYAIGYHLTFGLIARKRQWPAAWATITATVLNIALNLALIPSLGATGAALVTTASYAIEAVILWMLMLREAGPVRIDRALAVPVGASAVMAAVLLLTPSRLVVQVVVGVVVYLAAWYPLARWWAPEQVEVLHSLVVRRRSRAPERPRP
jgi:O-antigen/teichoic acid export membrane protein